MSTTERCGERGRCRTFFGTVNPSCGPSRTESPDSTSKIEPRRVVTRLGRDVDATEFAVFVVSVVSEVTGQLLDHNKRAATAAATVTPAPASQNPLSASRGAGGD